VRTGSPPNGTLALEYRIRYCCLLALRPLIPGVLVALLAAGCGSAASRDGGQKIERTFPVRWVDRPSQTPVVYTTRGIRFHLGRWSAVVTVANNTGKPLYEARWTPTDSFGSTWNGPALVFSGLNVMGARQLIFSPADTEVPQIPFPLPPGARWHGTIGGRLQAVPKLPHGSPIWLRFPVFGVGEPWNSSTSPALGVTWISDKAIEL
jgi:hypothetical protein